MAVLTASRITSRTSVSTLAPVMAATAGYAFGIVKTIDFLKANELKHSCKSLGLQSQPLVNKTLQICTQHEAFGIRRSLRPRSRNNSASATCWAALNATASAVETLRRMGRKKTITATPLIGEIKAPRLSHNGPRLPPRGPGGGGGGDGGAGGAGGYRYLFGGFFLLVFLAFLAYLKDQEDEYGRFEGRQKTCTGISS